MMTKTLGTLVIAFLCILMLPIFFGILGGLFGAVMGILGAIFGVIGGIIGGLFSAIFGGLGSLFDGIFNWHLPFGFISAKFFALVAIIFAFVMISKSRRPQ
jgi:hypothetical protein